ncbi:phosphoribosylformylglycinamidine synthase subunit PurS [Helicobacter pullorum]|uniref:Phosphoribosylformylglycinamidine synthase subunit PurS n=1 Tax=Helicobacter pullorum TaxID=35818 RepID=A0A0N1EDB3_9HELI|nr:phosphoribosylformylglycinamidine synthase subunit PurS [Helicobacter pullorum]KAB0575027.1 phosphoribosylformylglycinamidine synthase subunit PurS [Helicobacter pullorum NCTC 12824]KPH50793.1 phosphoribosylformylglycinamidine synthase [Helicobacter pullorum]KPH53420.1 phosphoribosylformylglycinamidine synthase [Helicobacter pullorum]KPH55837.1 phosphoribosylformylglycinamidine synthase [Helicobacter pullorum]OCR06361.1 phosphoribosylformylglycinamidine synthase [Helicobacter pullorum]
MKVEVIVSLKDGVLDPQGKAIGHALESLGHKDIKEVKVGKVITLEIAGEDRAAIQKEVEVMCESLLANTVIENYTIKM